MYLFFCLFLYGTDYLLRDPEFASTDPQAFDFHLTPHSPAIDAGIRPAGIDPDMDGNTQGLDFDRDGMMRPQGGAYDMGAYEWVWRSTQTPIPVSDEPGEIADDENSGSYALKFIQSQSKKDWKSGNQ